MTKHDYIQMAKWISENTSSDVEWYYIRATLIKFVCFVASTEEKKLGNKKVFDQELFRRAIVHFDKESKEK